MHGIGMDNERRSSAAEQKAMIDRNNERYKMKCQANGTLCQQQQ